MTNAMNGSMEAEQRGEWTRPAKFTSTYNGISSMKLYRIAIVKT